MPETTEATTSHTNAILPPDRKKDSSSVSSPPPPAPPSPSSASPPSEVLDTPFSSASSTTCACGIVSYHCKNGIWTKAYPCFGHNTSSTTCAGGFNGSGSHFRQSRHLLGAQHVNPICINDDGCLDTFIAFPVSSWSMTAVWRQSNPWSAYLWRSRKRASKLCAVNLHCCADDCLRRGVRALQVKLGRTRRDAPSWLASAAAAACWNFAVSRAPVCSRMRPTAGSEPATCWSSETCQSTSSA